MLPTVPTLEDALAKIDRAKKHIRDIERRIGDLEDSYSAVIKVHDDNPCIEYDLGDKAAVKDISLLIGDALHNLKCALDYGWLIALERHAPKAINNKTQFPAHETRDALESALTDRKKDLDIPLVKFMLTKIKPYSGGNDAVWDVKQLNNMDKHRLLLPLIGYTTIVGLEMEDESGEPVKRLPGVTMQPPPWRIPIPNGHHVMNKGKPSLDVLFGEGTPVNHCNAPTLLNHYSAIVMEVVKALDAFV